MSAERFRFQVIASWRVGCIVRSFADRAEYVGRHHRPTHAARPAVQG